MDQEGQPGTRLESWTKRVNLGQCKDKSCYYHNLKPDSGVDWGKAQVTSQEGQHELTWVNVWIKIVIIIVLKLNSGVDPRQGLGYGSGESIRLTHLKK